VWPARDSSAVAATVAVAVGVGRVVAVRIEHGAFSFLCCGSLDLRAEAARALVVSGRGGRRDTGLLGPSGYVGGGAELTGDMHGVISLTDTHGGSIQV
jgi:hypothetical protein